MQAFRHFAVLSLCAAAVAANAQTPDTVTVDKGGCQVRVRAYTDSAYTGTQASRYTFEIVRTSPNSGSWDFTLDTDPSYHYTNLSGGVSPVPYSLKVPAILNATLHEYRTQDEPVTFHNLTLAPLSSTRRATPARALILAAPVTVKTPSGISVTLPAQGADTLENSRVQMSGNQDALFIRVATTPDQRDAVLPASPLYRTYRQPVTIAWDCPKPDYMVWYKADNTFKIIAVGMPHLKTLTHLDTLTLILRQRIDVQSIPLAITLPAPDSAGP